jgi:hypothetical protein
MNWQFTRANQVVRFEADEPFCHIFPVARGQLEAISPIVRELSDAPQLEANFKTWSVNRDGFNADLAKPGSKAAEERWQKTYFRGFNPDGRRGTAEHKSKLRLKPFAKSGKP